MTGLTKWLIGLMSLWVMFTVIACFCEMAWAEPTAQIGTKLQTLLSPQWSVEGVQSVTGTLWDMFWWDYPFLKSGVFVVFRYLGMAISCVLGLIIVVEILMLLINSVGRIFGLARG